jgi:hypothetical protein
VLASCAGQSSEQEANAERNSDREQRIAANRGVGLVIRIDRHILGPGILFAGHASHIVGKITDLVTQSTWRFRRLPWLYRRLGAPVGESAACL